jgi:tetratricopeptide (TPR) repeat protein
MQNVGPGIKSDEGTTGLPFVLRAGLAWHLFPATQVRKKGLLLTGEIDAPIDDTPRPRAGLEYEIRLKETVRTQFRGGWRSTAGTVEEGELSLGFGLTARTIRFNYAYVPNQALGANQWVDVGFQFGGLPARQVERDKLLAEAQSQLNEGRLTAAEATLEGVLKISPKNPTARQMASDIQRRFDQSVHPETLYILGDRAFARESYGEAVEYLQKLILVDPNHVEGKKLLATAEAKVARARADRVKKDMAAARQKETNDLLRRAKSKTNQGEWLLALPAWRQVLAQDHANQQGKAGVQQAQEALYAEARAFESAGQWEKAISIYQTMKEDDPTFKDCSKRQSSLNDQRRTQNRERAQGKYEEGLRALKQNKIMEARHLFQEAVDLDPKNKTFIKALERTHP